MTRKIGILMTNTDVSPFAQKHPKDGEKFTTLMKSVRPEWMLTVYDVTQAEFPSSPAECDGYVITGSPASVNDTAAWVDKLLDFIPALAAAGVPAVGCCFGHQAIAKAMGGHVANNSGGWAFGTAETQFATLESWMQPPTRQLTLFAAHNEQVTQLPAGANALGGSAFCPFASFKMGTQFFTTQYHPEMTPEFITALSHEIAKYVGEPIAVEARRQATQPTHGPHFAEWMARFLELPR
jgi:GMP synthase-like glutamine amidotransferase